MTKGLKNTAVAASLALTGAFAAACATPVHNKVTLNCEKAGYKGSIVYTHDEDLRGVKHSTVQLDFPPEASVPTEDGPVDSPSIRMTDAENAIEIVNNQGWVCQDSAGKPVVGKLKF
jgi:hypothetical protein